jgi:hypothetical protein
MRRSTARSSSGEPPVRSRAVANDPGSQRQGNQTVLISLGIPKLVRFHKIRPQQLLHGIIIPLSPAVGGLPARRVERADAALTPRAAREKCIAIGTPSRRAVAYRSSRSSRI